MKKISKVKCSICLWSGLESELIYETESKKEDIESIFGAEASQINEFVVTVSTCPVCGSEDIEDYDFNPYLENDEEEDEDDGDQFV